MSDIDNTIERVKEEIDFAAKGNPEPLYCEHLIDDTVTIITAYEESQKAKEEFKALLESSHNCIKHLVKDHKTELETANKRIAYLEKCNDYYEGNRSTHPSKEQPDER